MSTQRTAIIALKLVLSFVLLISGQATAFDTKESSIEHIRGNVYYAHHPTDDTIYNSIFLVTEEGIVLVDPIHVDAATWLKRELQERFGQEVRYIIYSHFHWDHAPGAEAFSDTVSEIYAQEYAVRNIKNDKNKNKVKVLPTKTYKGRMELSVGNQTIELLDLTSDHTDDTTIVRFPAEKIIFTVDIAPVGRVAWRYFGGYTVEQVNDLDRSLTDLETILALDFDIIAPGHYDYKTRADLWRTYDYVVKLCERVAEEIKAGSDLPQIIEKVTMADYSDLMGYDRYVAMNVEGMHYWLTHNSSNRRCGN